MAKGSLKARRVQIQAQTTHRLGVAGFRGSSISRNKDIPEVGSAPSARKAFRRFIEWADWSDPRNEDHSLESLTAVSFLQSSGDSAGSLLELMANSLWAKYSRGPGEIGTMSASLLVLRFKSSGWFPIHMS